MLTLQECWFYFKSILCFISLITEDIMKMYLRCSHWSVISVQPCERRVHWSISATSSINLSDLFFPSQKQKQMHRMSALFLSGFLIHSTARLGCLDFSRYLMSLPLTSLVLRLSVATSSREMALLHFSPPERAVLTEWCSHTLSDQPATNIWIYA